MAAALCLGRRPHAACAVACPAPTCFLWTGLRHPSLCNSSVTHVQILTVQCSTSSMKHPTSHCIPSLSAHSGWQWHPPRKLHCQRRPHATSGGRPTNIASSGDTRPDLLRLVVALERAAATYLEQVTSETPSESNGAMDVEFLAMASAATLSGMQAGMFGAAKLASIGASLAVLLDADTQEACLPQAWAAAFMNSTQEHMGDMGCDEVVLVAGAVAQLGLIPSANWLGSLLQQAARHLEAMSGRDCCRLVQAIALMGYRPPDTWLDVLCLRTFELRLSSLAPADLVALSGALVQFGYRPPVEWVQDFTHKAVFHSDGFDAPGAATVLHAICTFQVFPDPTWLRAAYTQMLFGMEVLPAQAFPNILWSICSLEVAKGGPGAANINFMPPASWLEEFYSASLPHLDSLNKEGVVKLLWGLAAGGLPAPPPWLLRLLARTRELLQAPATAQGSEQQGFDSLELLYIARCSDLLWGHLSSGGQNAKAVPAPAARPPPVPDWGPQSTRRNFDGDADDDASEVVATVTALQPVDLDLSGADPWEVYRRLGPPAQLAQLVKEANVQLQQAAAAAQLPPDWRRVNVLYPPYGLPEPTGSPGASTGSDGRAQGGDSRASQGSSQVQQGALFGPPPPPKQRRS